MVLRHLLATLLPLLAIGASGDYFQIRIVDRDTGRGVPMVSFTTNNHIVCISDSNGIVAWNEPGLMDRDVYFRIESPGYRFPDGGRVIHVVRGGKEELRIQRLEIAERLYRVTGQGIYRDSALTGFPVPVREPVLNSEVLGQDTVRVAPYHGKLFWLWGDTDRAGRPYGNFATTSATSELPGSGGLDPSLGVDLKYFTNPDGFVKPMCPWPIDGLKWLHALLTVHDPSGAERLVARYDSIGKQSKSNESGLAVFNDNAQEFERLAVFPKPDPEVSPEGVPPFRVRSGGADYFYFCDPRPTPVVRVRADWKSIQDLDAYEVFDGQWKPSTTLPKKRSTWLDVETGESVSADTKVEWNAYRKRWIGISQRNPGEVWYAEADTPVGPWVYTTRVASHDGYFFYWPVRHPFFDQAGGRIIYFEGTYTDTFSGKPVITPRYNYNQLMYRLSLDDSRLFLPAPVYRLKDGRLLMRDGVEAADAWDEIAAIPFYALPHDRSREGTIDIRGLFYALPATPHPLPQTVAGNWGCPEFSLGIVAQGDQVNVQALDLPSVTGTLRGGVVRFVLRTRDGSFDTTATLKGDELAVEWKESNGDVGAAVCKRGVPSEQWLKSTALIPLYFHGGSYTTEPNPGAAPVARVWRNPSAELMLDRRAAPVRVR